MAPSTPAFAGLAPLSRPGTTRQSPSRCATTRMAAGEESETPKKQSIIDWVLSKTMPHQDEKDEFGYEPFFKNSMDARDAAKKAEYDKRGKEN